MFNAKTFEQAQEMTVGACNGLSKEIRWKEETKVFTQIIFDEIEKTGIKKILDFGCGSGRLAKVLLESDRLIEVIGIDFSEDMRRLATNYVLSDRFRALDVSDIGDGCKVNMVICSYVLQHVQAIELREIIQKLGRVTDKMLLINSVCRMAAHEDGFKEDGINVLNEVARVFKTFRNALPFQTVVENRVIRKMFLEGGTLHYAVWCEK